jgi:hypothetical protein
MHLVLVVITVVFIVILMPLLGLGFSGLYGWKYFAVFTFASLALIIVSGISSPIVIGRGLELMGLTERVTGYAFYIWLFVLAYLLINETGVRITLPR